MDNSQIIADRIKLQAKNQNQTVKSVLENCSLNKNYVNSIANGKDVGYQSLVTIADYLGCSVDFLLGRENKNAPDDIRSAIINRVYNLSDKKAQAFLAFLESLASEAE